MLLGYSSLPLALSPRGRWLHQMHRMPTCPMTTAALFPPLRFLAIRSEGQAAKYSIWDRSRHSEGDSQVLSAGVDRRMLVGCRDVVMEEESWDEAEAAAEVAPPEGSFPTAAVLDRFNLFWPFLIVLMPPASESAAAAATPDVDVFLRLLVLMSCSSNLSWWCCITMCMV